MSRNHWIHTLAFAAFAAFAAAACGGSAQETVPPRHVIASESAETADPRGTPAASGQNTARPTRESQTQNAPDVGCFDPSIPDPDSGGERIRVLRPCWTAAAKPISAGE